MTAELSSEMTPLTCNVTDATHLSMCRAANSVSLTMLSPGWQTMHMKSGDVGAASPPTAVAARGEAYASHA